MEQDLIHNLLGSAEGASWPFALGLYFVLGILSSLTPCVYPLIPITISLFGVSSETSRKRAFFLSLCYVLGIAFTYTILGVISAKSGKIFGSFLGNPIVIGVLVIVLVALTLSTLDMIKLPFLSQLQTKASLVEGRGHSGAFIMGSVSGFVAAPCVGPVLVVILGYVAASQNTFWGASLLFSYSLGLGLLFLLLGTFSGLVNRLPRSGNWLYAVKFVMAVGLLLVALFVLQPLFVASIPLRGASLTALVCASLVIAFFIFGRGNALLKLAASALVAVSLFQYIIPQAHSGESSSVLQWNTSLDSALKSAGEQKKIVMLDLYADWCGACKEFELHTFADVAVQSKLKTLVLARIDFTLPSDLADQLTEKYSILGLPSILFLDANGAEIPDSRLTGFLNAEEFLKHLNKVTEML